MSRVKLWIGILAVMVLALGPAAVQASLVNFDATHTFSTTIERVGLGTFLTPISGNITTGVSGYADYNPSEGNNASAGPTPVTIGTPSSPLVNVNPAAGSWLKSSYTSTSYNGGTGGVISHAFTGWGPDPDVNVNGDIGQKNYTSSGPSRTQLLHLVFKADLLGSNYYRVNFADAYSLFFNMDQSSGSVGYAFSYMDAKSTIFVTITGGTSGGSTNFNKLFEYTAGDGSAPIPSYSYYNPTGSWSYGPADYLLAKDALLTVDVTLTDYYDAKTTPLPSTLLLLGFGLVALAGLGRRYRYKKS